MLCQNCGKNQATTHVKKTINGETTELHLCAACAAKQGLGSMWNGFGFDLGDFWHDFGIQHKKPAEYLVLLQRDALQCGRIEGISVLYAGANSG